MDSIRKTLNRLKETLGGIYSSRPWDLRSKIYENTDSLLRTCRILYFISLIYVVFWLITNSPILYDPNVDFIHSLLPLPLGFLFFLIFTYFNKKVSNTNPRIYRKRINKFLLSLLLFLILTLSIINISLELTNQKINIVSSQNTSELVSQQINF